MRRTSNPLELVRLLINGANEYEKETGNKNPTVYLSRNNLLVIEKALRRLESIDNAEPSEALECLEQFINEMTRCLENPKEYVKGYEKQIFWKYKNTFETTIKQALLKAQEQKHYLKWEDFEKDRTYKVLLNGIQYELIKRYDDYECHSDYITLQKKPGVSIFIYEYEKEIFNDLRLERVEE